MVKEVEVSCHERNKAVRLNLLRHICSQETGFVTDLMSALQIFFVTKFDILVIASWVVDYKLGMPISPAHGYVYHGSKTS